MRKIARPTTPLDPDYLIRKHTPGGHDHDQQSHAGGGGGGESAAATADAPKAPKESSPLGEESPQKKRVWIDHYPGLPKDTQKHYQRNGEYVPERKALHEKIISKFSDDVPTVPESERPVALVMMGGSGSGKSSLDKGILANYKMVHVDPDAVKDEIPEFVTATSDRNATAKDAALMAHEESGDIAKTIRERAINARKNVFLDGTGKNLDDYTKTIKRLRGLGYDVTVMMPDIDFDIAWPRIESRAEKKGRLVPQEVAADIHRKVPPNFEPIAREANHFFLFDNRGKKPRLVWSGVNGKETQHDPDFVSQFRGKHGKRS